MLALQSPTPSILRRLDALLLAALVIARIRIDTLADAAVLPLRQNDVARHPWLGHLLPSEAMKLLAQQQLVDPVGLLLIVGAIGCLLVYLLVDEFGKGKRSQYWAKLVLIWSIVLLTVLAPSLKLALLRQGSGPASYSHDGGVIQTEATIDFLLHGRNPYVENYLNTPMAEWGINEFRTAVYHYPYLPCDLPLFGAVQAPFRPGPRLVRPTLRVSAALCPDVAALAGAGTQSHEQAAARHAHRAEPDHGSDLIYGQNDSFVLAWIVLSLWLWSRGQRAESGKGWQLASAAAFGLACASKPTAWFLAPFYLLLAAGGDPRDIWRKPLAWISRWGPAGWPALAVALLIIGPYLIWNPGGDVRRRLAMVQWHLANGIPDLGVGRVEPVAGSGLGEDQVRPLALLAAGIGCGPAADACAAVAPGARKIHSPLSVGLRAVSAGLLLRSSVSSTRITSVTSWPVWCWERWWRRACLIPRPRKASPSKPCHAGTYPKRLVWPEPVPRDRCLN